MAMLLVTKAYLSANETGIEDPAQMHFFFFNQKMFIFVWQGPMYMND